MLGTLIALAGRAWSDAPAPKWYDTIAFSGYLQGSYVGNLSSPQLGSGGNAPNVDRVFDQESNSFNLNAFHLQVTKPVGDDNYGFTVKMQTGRDARIIGSTGFGATDFDLEEAYLTYVVPCLKKLSFIGGKFVTLEGVEVIESPLNPNFSEGLLFGFAEPFTHTGVKANYAFTDKVNATVGVVNGWDTSADVNSGKTVIWQIATTPIKQVSWSLEGTYGPEALVTNNSMRNSVDSVINYNVTDKLSLWGQANWGQDSNVTALAPTRPGSATVHWSGLGAWVQYVFNSWYTEALRFEVFDDQSGADRLGGLGGGVTGVPVPSEALDQTQKEITWTHKFQLTKGIATRLEYRHDWSNEGVFFGHAAGSTGKDQNTISADWVVTF
jgi:hypothetical protein